MEEYDQTPDALKERWSSGIWVDALRKIHEQASKATRLITFEFIANLNLPLFDGRLDLRGIPFFAPIEPPIRGADKSPLRFKGENLNRIDFSFSHIYVYVSDSAFRDCLFNGATLESSVIDDSNFLECSFCGAKFLWLSISGSSTIESCSFNRSQARHTSEIRGNARLLKCSFQEIDWRALEIEGLKAGQCSFSGKLHNSKIKKASQAGLVDRIKALVGGSSSVFEQCAFEKLQVIRLSIQDEAVRFVECSGIPKYLADSKEGSCFKDYYSQNQDRHEP